MIRSLVISNILFLSFILINSSHGQNYRQVVYCSGKEKLPQIQAVRTIGATLLALDGQSLSTLLISETIDRYQGAAFTTRQEWLTGVIQSREPSLQFLEDGYDFEDKRSGLVVSNGGIGLLRLMASEGSTKTITTSSIGMKVECQFAE